MFLMKKNKEIYIKDFGQIYVMDNICQQIIHIIRLQILLVIRCNLQKRDSFIVSYFSFCAT